MSSEFRMQVTLGKDISLLFQRLKDGRVALGVALEAEFPHRLDKYRLPVILLGEAVIDFEEFRKHFESLKEFATPLLFVFEPRFVVAGIWHGQLEEGSGLMGILARTKQLLVRMYYDDYTTEDFNFSFDALRDLQKLLVERFGV